MSKAVAIATSLFFLLGVLTLAPLWAVCFIQSMRWLHKAEGEIKPGMRLRDGRLSLLFMLGRSAALAQSELLTEKGLIAREATLLWLRRLLLTTAAIFVLVALHEFMDPQPMTKRGQISQAEHR